MVTTVHVPNDQTSYQLLVLPCSIPTTLFVILSIAALMSASSLQLWHFPTHKAALSVSSYATRVASIAPLSLYALKFACPVLTCLPLSDVNTLNAFVVGGTLTVFVIRVASTIHASITRALMSNVPLFEDVRSSC